MELKTAEDPGRWIAWTLLSRWDAGSSNLHLFRARDPGGFGAGGRAGGGFQRALELTNQNFKARAGLPE